MTGAAKDRADLLVPTAPAFPWLARYPAHVDWHQQLDPVPAHGLLHDAVARQSDRPRPPALALAHLSRDRCANRPSRGGTWTGKFSKIEMPSEIELREMLPKTMIGKLSRKELKPELEARRKHK